MRRHLLLLTLLLGPVACDDATSSKELCSELLVERGAYRLLRCADGRSVQLDYDGEALVRGATVEVVGELRNLSAAAWPTAAWQVQGDAARLRLSGLPDEADLEWTITLGAEQVRFELVAEGPGGDLGLVALSGSMDAAPSLLSVFRPRAAYGPASLATLRFTEDVVLSEPPVWFGVDPQGLPARLVVGGLVRVTATRHAELGEGERSSPLAVTLRVGDDAASLLDAPGEAPPRPWGWRSGRAYGARIGAAAIEHQNLLLQELAADLPRPWIVADGRWQSATGDWVPGPSFPNGLGSLTPDANLVLRWPAMHVEEAAMRRSEHPEWVAVGDTLDRGALLDPSIPAVREALARDLANLLDQGVAAVILADDIDRWPVATRTLVAQLIAIAPVHAESTPDAASLATGALEFPTHPDCLADSPIPANACPPVQPEDTIPSAPLPIEAVAARLTLFAHRAAAVDAGPVELAARTLGEARQMVALAAIAGGPYLLADDLETLDPERAQMARAPLLANVGRAFPTDITADGQPPSRWVGDRTLALFNWTGEAREFQLEDTAWQDVFGGEVTDPLRVPPNDVRLLRRP